MKRRAAATVATILTTTVALGACGSAQPTGTGDAEVSALASFYPLQYVTEQVGGDRVDVSSLTPAGAEPHDLELSPNAVAGLSTADVVVYLSGFQPAVDEAVEQTSPARVVDAAMHADLETVGPHTHDGETAEPAHSDEATNDDHADDAAHTDETTADEEHSADDGHGHAAGADPHFWLDPLRMGEVAADVAAALTAADPDGAAAYAANAERVQAEMAALDTELHEGLATCESRTIVVSHEAFGYLTQTYGLEQVGIAGLDPDTEPSPARLAEIADVVRSEGVSTIFTESLVSSRVAETLATDLGVAVAVLDPVEGLVDETKDYPQLMRENLAALQEALSCA